MLLWHCRLGGGSVEWCVLAIEDVVSICLSVCLSVYVQLGSWDSFLRVNFLGAK